MTTPGLPAVPPISGRTFGVIAGCVTVLVVALLAALVGLFALAPVSQRPDIGPLFTAIGAGVPGVLGALVVWLNSRRQHAETTGALGVITAQTNGILTDRISAGVASALAARDAAASVYVPAQTGAPVALLAPAGSVVTGDRRGTGTPPAATPDPLPVPAGAELLPSTP